ncbi:MAG: terminase [Tolumonas sp.]|nr:terminase [Tolumonas sp.]
MANDWNAINQLFQIETERTGVSAKEWCEQNGYNYQSARRYLKTRAQSVTTSKTSRTAAQSSNKKPKKNAQTAQKSLRKPNAQNNPAQSAQSAQCANGNIDADDENDSPEIEPDIRQDAKPNRHNKQDSSAKGVRSGNPNPVNLFEPKNDIAVKHGGYAKYFPQTEYFDDAELMSLHDELTFTRARVISVTKNLQKMHDDLSAATEIPDRIALYGKITAAEQALDRNVARVESLTRTLSAIRIDDVNEPKIIADTDRIKSARRKLDAETARLERDQGGDTTPVGEIVEDLQQMGSGGLMS